MGLLDLYQDRAQQGYRYFDRYVAGGVLPGAVSPYSGTWQADNLHRAGDFTVSLFDEAGSAVGRVGNSATGAIGNAAGGIFKGLLTSPGGVALTAAAAGVLYLYLRPRK